MADRTLPSPEVEEVTGTEEQVAPPWMTVLHNCDCHTFEQVVKQLQKAIACSEAEGWQPNTEPRPVVKQMRLQPPATRPVIDTGSWPGVSMKTKPRVVMGSPYMKTSIIGVVPPLVTPPSDFSKTVVIPPALLPGAGLLSIASIPRQYHSHHL